MIRKERAFYLCVAVIIEIYDISIKGVVVLKSSLYTRYTGVTCCCSTEAGSNRDIRYVSKYV